MIFTRMALLALGLTMAAAPAFADPGKGKGKGHGRNDVRQEYWDGDCKVERRWKGNKYKEKVKCHPDERVVVAPAPVYVQPAPVIVQPPPQPGLTLHVPFR